MPMASRPLSHRLASAVLTALVLAGCGGTGAPSVVGGTGGLHAAPSSFPAADGTPDGPSGAPLLTAPSHVPDILRPGNLATAARGVPEGVDPERVRIPAIGVDADIIDLGLNPDQTMQVPTDFAQTGWFQYSPLPGRPGASVIAGHVDSTTGPAVFYRLRELAPGDRIEVEGGDGTVVTFEVDRVEQYAKADFPGHHVYASSGEPELRLITCGGPFDRSTGHYLDNVVVYADRVGA